MGKGRYDFLEGVDCIKKSDYSYDYAIHDFYPKAFGWYACNVFLNRRKGESNDVGDKILRSFDERMGFCEDEKLVAYNFFCADYSRSLDCSTDCFGVFEREDDWSSAKNDAYLALVLARRAEESLSLAESFSRMMDLYDDEIFYPECFSDIADFRRRVHLAVEFPDNYMKLTDLVMRMDRAVGKENYEEAAMIRDEINCFMRLGVD